MKYPKTFYAVTLVVYTALAAVIALIGCAIADTVQMGAWMWVLTLAGLFWTFLAAALCSYVVWTLYKERKDGRDAG